MITWRVHTLGYGKVDIEGKNYDELMEDFESKFPGSMSFGLLAVHLTQRILYTLAYLRREDIPSRGLLKPSEVDFDRYYPTSD